MTFANNATHTYCNSRGTVLTITAPVLECTEFSDRNTPSRWDMEQIAWTLTTDKSGQKIGFTPPKKDNE